MERKTWNGKLGTGKTTEYRTEVEPGTLPIRSVPYRQGPAMHEHVKSEFDKVLLVGVIEPATSEWTSPVVFAPKGGTLHFCIDYRKLNWKTLSDTFPLPRMDDFIDSPGIASIFCTLDCSSGYWQIPVAESDKDKTTFMTLFGTYRYTRMPFRLKNAPATFHCVWTIFCSEYADVCVLFISMTLSYPQIRSWTTSDTWMIFSRYYGMLESR